MRRSVFVSEERVLDLSLAAAQPRLDSLARRGGLDQASRAAYESGLDHQLRVGPFGGVPGASRLVRIQFVEPVYRDGAMTMGMRWEATGVTGGLFPVLDANLSLADDSAGHGTRLALTAAYRPPLGGLGAELDRLLLHRVAAQTVSLFLARVASALEGDPPEADEAAAPAWPERRPETARPNGAERGLRAPRRPRRRRSRSRWHRDGRTRR
jgi:hypothetical protein